MRQSRREFLKHSAAAGALVSTPFVWSSRAAAASDSRLKLAAIGVGGSRGACARGRAIAERAARFADMASVCDVDAVHAAEFNKKFKDTLKTYGDYRELLEKEKPQVVTIGTPHYGTPVADIAVKLIADPNAAALIDALARSRATLARRVSVMMFPEGTRSTTDEMLQFKDGAFLLAIEAGVPILPLAVAGTRTALPKHDWKFGRAVAEVTILEPVETTGLTSADADALKLKVRDMILRAREGLRARLSE